MPQFRKKKFTVNNATLAYLSYGNTINKKLLPEGWYHIDISSVPYLQAYVFSNGHVNIVSYRGTQDQADVFNDIQLYVNKLPIQVNLAIDFLDSVEAKWGKIDIHVGHSLGGAIAKLIAAKKNATAIAFDAPGVVQLIDNLNETKGFIEYLSGPNCVNTVGRHDHMGEKYKIEIKPVHVKTSLHIRSYIDYTLEQHSIVNIINGLKNGKIFPVEDWPSGFFSGYNHFISYKQNHVYLRKFIYKTWDKLSMDSFLLIGGDISLNVIHTQDILEIAPYQLQWLLKGIAFGLASGVTNSDSMLTFLEYAEFPEYLLQYQLIHYNDFASFIEFKDFMIKNYFNNKQTYAIQHLEPLILKIIAQYDLQSFLASDNFLETIKWIGSFQSEYERIIKCYEILNSQCTYLIKDNSEKCIKNGIDPNHCIYNSIIYDPICGSVDCKILGIAYNHIHDEL